MMRSILLTALCLLAGLLSTATAQTSAPYRGFRFDSAFHMGAHGIRHVRFARDSLRLEFTQTYGGPSGLARLRDSTRWHTDPGERWADRIEARFYDSAARLGFKVIYAPQELRDIQGSAWGSETWYDYRSDSTHVGNFDAIISRWDVDPSGPISYDSVYNHHVWGASVAAASPPRDTLIAGGPRFTRYDGVRGTADPYLWGRMSAPGVPSFADSSDWFDLTLTIKTDTTLLKSDTIPPTTVIAYAILYMRDTTGQSGPGACPCSFYRAVDTFKVTKERYQDLDRRFGTIRDSASGFRDIVFPFKRTGAYTAVPSRTIRVVAGVGDTVTAVGAGLTYREARVHETLELPGGTPRADTSRNGRYCRALYDSLRAGASPVVPAGTIHRIGTVEGSDLMYDVYTTRRVAVTFRKGAIVSHLYTAVRRGYLDHLIDSVVNATLGDVALDTMLMKVGVTDEAWLPRFGAYREVSSKMQRAMLHRNDSLGRPADKRGVWSNPVGDHAAFRINSGDLDSTEIRMVHMQASQAYHFGGALPITYASTTRMRRDTAGHVIEPISMDSIAIYGFYRMSERDDTAHVDSIDACGKIVWGAAHRLDTVLGRYIMGNSPHDYAWYTERNQTAYRDFRLQLRDAIDVSHHRYAYLNKQPYPVWCAVQVHGWIGSGGFEAHRFDYGWRPTTPEEVRGQCWLALCSGVNGIVFSDFTYDGAEFGVMHDKDPNRRSEYDTVSAHHIAFQGPQWVLPYQWLGFTSRLNAVKHVTNHFADTIIPVYLKLDRGSLRHTHIADVANGCLPHVRLRIVDSIYTERADEHDTIVKPFKPTGQYDAAGDTYLDVTDFVPGPMLPAEAAANVTYLMVSNTRSWPVDHRHYKDSSLWLFDSVARFAPAVLADGRRSDTVGLGNIDVRRPVVILRNSVAMIGDSFKIERIGDTLTWRVKAGQSVPLAWLAPGWGALYRITPIATHVSALATAYNNAVHALNPSVDGAVRDRIVVYERDSAVYLRALDSAGVWGPENIISRPNDTVSVAVGDGTYRNKADNMSPAIDMLRSSGNSCLIVWERHDRATDSVTVESAYLPFKPKRDSFPASNTIVRTRLSAPRPFAQSWMKLTPSVTGVDSGYVVAWAAPDYTVELKAVRNGPSGLRTDTSRVLRVKMPAPSPTQPLDSACGYPTLAYRRNWNDSVALNDGIASALTDTTDQRAMPPHAPGVPDTTTALHILHLAYQQGARSNSGWHIMYNTLGVKFPGVGAIPELWAAPTEEASYNMRGCEFVYPSIGVDSARVGVTFTRRGTYGSIALRFRNDALNTARALRWSVPTYHWGGADFRARGAGPFPLIGFRNYERSSVTLFPARDSTSLRTSFEGALTWHWINTPNNGAGVRQHGVKFYRFGNIGTDSLNDGQHPTMMLVPCVGDIANHAMRSSGVLRRGPSIDAIDVARRATLYRYYTASLDNTPAAPLDVFTTSQQTDSVHSSFDIRSESAVLAGYTCPPSANGGVRGGFIIRPTSTHGGFPDPPGSVTPTPGGLPPSFFPNTPTGNGVVLSLSDAMAITRTGDFLADTVPVLLTRVLEGNDSLVEWLNSQPDDTITHDPANIFMAMRIVRASDDSVLWSGDTVSARGIGADTLIDELSVPVDSVATPGTNVYVQLVVATTAGLHYVVGGEFHFLHGDVSSSSLKTVRRETSPTPRGTPEAEIGVEMIPNPVRTDAGELHVRLSEAGKARITVYDLVGNRVLVLPDLAAKRAGTYTVPVDLSALRAGLYVVEVRMNGKRGTTQASVVR